ncbi:N-acetyl-gamma-glutamyl-phosphate reductase [Bacillus sp. ISL-40]|uniref:N-acetyl-gamma-glutamyl-phosphate reductase n=1 Tax=unclassified Bacillus (in: firmicutes) TaxID=185979 RepID=UPI001BEB113B|nr:MULTISPECIES: N-acetyl-gamma-glutamyl-phosphate reductase [unclassified Bacillus (in: firmicutes)]MBT2699938.1 N-acetyl-gamma-glutamyl-phosphate reductase [Bacillus sp. ISL-40]MBT2722957.1 N-acetyl-gamma-glutamyl-phosphate reductase [Bacillus sp. ISL-46]MBT2743757.1 N-acetyl-gamma-glutamyl-phosphate reductase [Bacillus sp. ISL-77]
MKVSIIGTTGYGGGELFRILHHHPVFRIQSVHTTRDELPLYEEFPHLNGITNLKLEHIDAGEIAKHSDIVFIAAPSGVSSKLVPAFADTGIQVIDLSGDLRLTNGEMYRKWYKHEPVDSHLLKKAVYGLSEWNKEKIIDAKLIANPGCYSTATLLGLAPVVKEGLIDPDLIIIDAKSGASGAGRSVSKSLLFSEINENFRIYKVNEHQHIPEIEQQLNLWNAGVSPITFNTHLLPITRGIMATIYVKLTEKMSTDRLIELYKEQYLRSPFVRIRKKGYFPSVKEVAGSNYCDIGLHVDERTGRLTIVSVIDNLMKGAAGQAVQNANLMNGLDEKTGLEFIPLYP